LLSEEGARSEEIIREAESDGVRKLKPENLV